MRLGRILFGAVWSAATLAAPTASADEFKNPQVIRIRAPGGDLSIRARRGTASIPGLGEVEQVYGYEVFQGAKFSPGRRKTMELMPPVLSVDRGSTLRILYRNELLTADAAGKLQPTESNLHTHGLLVSAKGAGFAGDGRDRAYGDCIFVMASTSGAGARNPAHPDPGASGDPCSADPGAGPLRLENGEIHYGYVIAPDHPSGMYWFHPHPHQRSEGQVWNGLSGLLSVGDFWDTAYIKCLITSSPHLTGTGACRDLQDQRDELQARIAAARSLDIKYLGLKDIQVSRVNGPPGGPGKPRFRLIEFPLRADPADRSSREAFDRQTHPRHHRCGDLAVRPDGVAYVDGVAAPGQCWKKQSPDDRWIFTVSGQVHPRITIQAGHAEVWHLANIGADMTYRLRLETVEERPRLLAFDVRALDGAAFPPETQRRHSEIVLMPGARVDVLIQRCDPRGSPRTDCADPRERIEARLRTVGVATGLAADDGDRWPAVDLASVIFESGSGERQVNFGSAQPMAARPSEPEPPSPAASPAPPRSAGTACEPTRYQAVPADFRLDSNLVRLLRFNNRDFDERGGELFGIHVENFRMADGSGKPIAVADLVAEGRAVGPRTQAPAIASISLEDPCWRAATGGDGDAAQFARFYPSFRMDAQANLTARHGTREYWLLVNDSRECHNFHIHQSKFVVLDADFSASAGTPAAHCVGDRQSVAPVNRGVLHDNYPLPPGARVFVMIHFDGPKLGRFVFHCHILEHEDKGMMGTVAVIDGTPP